MRDRPIIDNLPWTRTDTLLQLLALLPTLVAGLVLAFGWSAIPDRVPTHLSLTGHINSWGDRSSLVVLLGVATLSATLLSLISRMPHLANLPVQVTEKTAPAIYVATRRFLLGVAFLTSVLFAGLVAVMTLIALGAEGDQGEEPQGALLWLLVAFGAAVAYSVVRFIANLKALAKSAADTLESGSD